MKSGKIKVVQQLVKVGSKHVLRKLKTESSQNSIIATPDEVIKALKEHVRFHDMRHTFALLSLQQGVDIKTLQSDLGHESIETTLDKYGHVNETMKKDAANKRSMLLKEVTNN
ncbi:MAG: tyrosine-type recombinase/integrase [Clostridia bacterium]|nr:tyrosine-type recombinase/integrase [Clostridia bacterium]